MRNKNKSGFTLIELLVVIAIIGLLASVVLLALNGARAKSRDAKRIADARQLASAFELMFNDSNAYPTGGPNVSINTGYTSAGGALLGAYSMGAWNAGSGVAYNLTPSYIGIIPTSPTPADGNCTQSGSGSNQYWYTSNNTGVTYALSFCLGGVTGGYSGGPHTLTPAGIQ